MAVVATNLTSGSDTDGNSSSTTASVTLTASRLYILTVVSRTGITANPNQPTATSTGATWVVDTNGSVVFDTTSSSRKRITVLRTMVGSNQTGAITIDFGGQNQTDVGWSIEEYTGTDTTGTNGSGAIVQVVNNFSSAGAGGTLTATLAAFGSSNNATVGAYSTDSVSASAGSGFSVVKNFDVGTSFSLLDEFNSGNDTSVDASCPALAGTSAGIIGIEIKAAATTAIKTVNGLAIASVKTVNGLAIASVKNWNGLA